MHAYLPEGLLLSFVLTGWGDFSWQQSYDNSEQLQVCKTIVSIASWLARAARVYRTGNGTQETVFLEMPTVETD